mgnify:CR=1 FL=1
MVGRNGQHRSNPRSVALVLRDLFFGRCWRSPDVLAGEYPLKTVRKFAARVRDEEAHPRVAEVLQQLMSSGEQTGQVQVQSRERLGRVPIPWRQAPIAQECRRGGHLGRVRHGCAGRLHRISGVVGQVALPRPNCTSPVGYWRSVPPPASARLEEFALARACLPQYGRFSA